MSLSETYKQLLDNCQRIAAELESPPLVNDDGEEVDYITGEDTYGEEHHVTDAKHSFPEGSWPNTSTDDDTVYIVDGEEFGYDEWIVDDKETLHLGGERVDLHQQSGYEWLADALSVEYICTVKSGDLIGADVLCTFGGPNIWVDTRFNCVRGRWGSDRIDISYTDNVGLDDAIEEMWENS